MRQVSGLENEAKTTGKNSDTHQKVVVEIFGETYRLKTDNDPQYLRDIAKMVDEKMKEISQKTRSFTGSRIGVLTAMEFADEYCQLKKDYEELMKLFDDE